MPGNSHPKELGNLDSEDDNPRGQKMLSSLKQVFGKEVHQLVSCIAQAADVFGVSVYLVGGPVRDLLLRRSSIDIDIMVEGNAISFVDFLSAQWGRYCDDFIEPRKAISFPRFKTAKLQFKKAVCPGIFELDFSSARVEQYPASGAQPEIQDGDLFGDLQRRDFTINALALRLNEPGQGELIDFFGGKEDLDCGFIRIIHKDSFQDDPARLLRAVRFMARFDFCLEKETLKSFTTAVENRFLERLPRFRLFDEFRKGLDEVQPVAVDALSKLFELGLIEQILPNVSLSTDSIEFLEMSDIEKMKELFAVRLGRTVRSWQVLLVLLCKELPLDTFSDALTGFEIKGKAAAHLVALRECWQERDEH